jgi:hypothetical protein
VAQRPQARAEGGVIWALVCALWVALAFWAGRVSAKQRPARGVPIKMRRQVDVAMFSVGQLLTIDEALPVLGFFGGPLTSGTIEEPLVVTALDWPAGTIYVRAAS